ncbi:MAG: YHS domain-containing protein [Actinobacteria bacterium]|nr:YHS domain-containing protein [Actinomycetota bacterium]
MKMAILAGCLCLAVSVGFVLAGCGSGEDTSTQTTCPVMGRKINKNIYEDYKGKRVYFCCNGCPKTFKDDPEKFMKKMADQGIILEDAP